MIYLITLVTVKAFRLGFHLEFHWFDSTQFYIPGKPPPPPHIVVLFYVSVHRNSDEPPKILGCEVGIFDTTVNRFAEPFCGGLGGISCWHKLGSCIWQIRVYTGDFFFFTAAVDVIGGDVFWPCCCRDGDLGRLLGLMFNSAVSEDQRAV